jgi:HK97 family phage major capsid protein
MSRMANLKQERFQLLDQAEKLLSKAESGEKLSASDETQLTNVQTRAKELSAEISAIEKKNTLLQLVQPGGFLLTDGPDKEGRPLAKGMPRRILSNDYLTAWSNHVQSGFRKVEAALYEGSDAAGGYAVPIVVDDQIVPLAPQEFAVRQIARVIPTTSDVKIPTQAAFGTAASKAETVAFGGTAPGLGQFTLSAFMAGVQNDISWELLQDVPVFQSFLVDDQIIAQQTYEENLYVNGSGSGEAQGLIGNVDAGITAEPDENGNLVSIDGTFDIIGTLKAAYHPGASWLMSRETGVIIRKAQAQSNLFSPVWTRVGTQDYLHGYPVFFSSSMPAATRGSTPLLFGDFKRGYIIGDRGGSGINVKVLDQPKAAQGLLTLLTYRRTDGRVRAKEAVKSYTIAAS